MILVGLSEIKLANKEESLRTIGLGSCVGVIIFDVDKTIAGMAHIMLPESKIAKPGSRFLLGKFADTAIPELVKLIGSYDIPITRLRSKMAGGAEMFKGSRLTMMGSIGQRNIKAIKEQLHRFDIPIIAEDVGGHSGRTIEFYTHSSILSIRTVNRDEKQI
ncbi:chemotaxis protein CheD [Terrilactibacillus laevilacticus]|uniref:Probable chemoreceptor glutamine deamidase CheD n=1 Tax=Terrilactibacillus laevilacticus TaxID=1380157 RepID=A0ABW5PPR6_9BACI|nr:chemotaxis protein CheD [Terrilactibacillus laevilacticus]